LALLQPSHESQDVAGQEAKVLHKISPSFHKYFTITINPDRFEWIGSHFMNKYWLFIKSSLIGLALWLQSSVTHHHYCV